MALPSLDSQSSTHFIKEEDHSLSASVSDESPLLQIMDQWRSSADIIKEEDHSLSLSLEPGKLDLEGFF